MAEEEKEPQQEQGEGSEQETPTLSEEELRQRLEAEIRTLTVQDVLLQSIVSVLNLSARRIAKEDERDLEQAKLGIDAVRALLPMLDESQAPPVRQALSELQMLYARQAGGEAAEEGEAEQREGAEPAAEGEGGESKLWTPSDSG
jgi:hypothetical protein